jgi:hypothetical protein
MKKIIKLLLVSIISIIMAGCGVDQENEIIVPASSSDYEGKDFQEVIDDLQNAGFTNIETEALDDLNIGWLTKDGEVDKVSINGDTSFSTSSKFPNDAKIVITYHTFPSTEMEEMQETTEAPETTEASGDSDGRNVSGFDTKTNQTITWCGIDFSFPSYFDVLDKGSTKTWMTYYPEEEDYYASFMFQSQEFSGSQEDFNSSISSIVESTIDSLNLDNTELQKSEEVTIAGLPGWTITYSKSDTDGDGVISNGSYSFAYNINTGKVVMITCIYDSNDQSQYDYLGDYKKVLETANLLAERHPISNNKGSSSDGETFTYDGRNYEIIEVNGGDLSGERLSNVAVDVGYGDRVYWALTNDNGQLIYVIADVVIPQDDDNEPVTSDGRYYGDEAKVPGTEQPDLDEGHVIADALGGVSNAYNITPQNSTLNRHGDQAYMEKVIRDAGGCEDFVATITYPDNETQIPSHYHYEYVLMGEKIVDDFDNVNPDEVNASLTQAPTKAPNNDKKKDLSEVDTNRNGKVTIAEAKAAGYKMPIYSDHWLYQYMDDRDGDGMVGE